MACPENQPSSHLQDDDHSASLLLPPPRDPFTDDADSVSDPWVSGHPLDVAGADLSQRAASDVLQRAADQDPWVRGVHKLNPPATAALPESVDEAAQETAELSTPRHQEADAAPGEDVIQTPGPDALDVRAPASSAQALSTCLLYTSPSPRDS